MKDVALHHARTVIHYSEAVRDASYSAGMHEDQSRMPQKAISERYYFYVEPSLFREGQVGNRGKTGKML